MTKKVRRQLSYFFDQPKGKWPAAIKARLADSADRLWSLAVRHDWVNRCAVCGETHANTVEAHHLIPRQHFATRYLLRNGIALCTHHHQFNKDVAPHQNAAGWLQWLLTHHTELWQWYMDTVADMPELGRVKDCEYYCDVIRQLSQYVGEQEFVTVVGRRFAQYLEQE